MIGFESCRQLVHIAIYTAQIVMGQGLLGGVAGVVVVTHGCKDERIGGMCQVVLVVRLGKQQGIVARCSAEGSVSGKMACNSCKAVSGHTCISESARISAEC